LLPDPLGWLRRTPFPVCKNVSQHEKHLPAFEGFCSDGA
jgi:hypothetical protein